MNEQELVKLVKSLYKSLMYCAPEAVEELMFDKLRPYILGPAKRIAELEKRIAELEEKAEDARQDGLERSEYVE